MEPRHCSHQHRRGNLWFGRSGPGLRRGRASDYFLTPYGRSQSFQASPRIYDTDPPVEYAWLVLVDPAAASPLADSTGVWLNPGLMITNGRPDGDDLFTTALGPDTQLPAWMAAKLCDPAAVSLSASLAQRFAEVHATLLRSPAPNPLERALLRVLIVHGWRRVALKAPALPDHLFSKRWRGADCRARFGQLLDQLPKPELAELQPDLAEAPST